jgi:AAA domain, putative AbiEii toxin, Type IV TA system
MKLVGYACRHPDPPLRTAFLPLSDLTVLLGPNDSGKSSLLRAVERDLDGGHFDRVDDERAKLIGGVFYVEVSDNELGAIVATAAKTRDEQRSKYGPRTQGRRPPWDDGVWAPSRYESPCPEDPRQWIELLRSDAPARQPILDALEDSRLVAVECAGRNQIGQRVWNVYWCLPALIGMKQELREAVGGSDLPFIARKRDGTPPYRVGFYIVSHGNAEHLHVDGAPIPMVSLGPYVDLPMPVGVAAPADFTAIRNEVDRGITRLVDVVHHCHHDVTLDGDPLSLEEERERESPRGWVERDGDDYEITGAAYAAAEFLSAATTRLLPEFVTRSYVLEVQLRRLDEWLQDAPFDIRLRSRAEGIAAPDFPVERAADGHRLWIQLALLDALEQVSIVESVIWQRASEAYEAERQVGTVDPRDVAIDSYFVERDAMSKRLQEVIDAFCGTNYDDGELPGGEIGEALTRTPTDEWVRGGARDRRFFLVDEPERHLHPRLQRAAASWLASTTSERHAPCLVATHSAPFLGLSAASARYVQVTRAGEQASLRAMNPEDAQQLEELASTMGFDRGELLTLVNLWLVVEGLTEKEAFETLFAAELRVAGIKVVPLHGTSKWQAVLDADALWRFTTAKVAVLFDNIPAQKVTEMQAMSTVELNALRKSSHEPNEIKDLSSLMGALARQGKTITPIPNPLPDLLNHLDDGAITRVFADYPGHAAAETAFEKQGKGRSEFLRKRYSVEKTPEAFGQIAADMVARGVKPRGLADIVEFCSDIALSRSV